MAVLRKLTDDELIERYLEPHPHYTGAARWRLKTEDGGYPVWTLVAVVAEDWSNTHQVAQDWGVSVEAIQALRIYYRRNKAAIDAWNLVNSGA